MPLPSGAATLAADRSHMEMATPPPPDLLEMHRFMLTARRLEEAFGSLHSYHPAVGEEAVVVGSFYKLADNDYISPHYRGALAAAYIRGADLRRLIAGVYGKITSYNHGRFRGDICMPIELRIIGLFSGILGSTIGLATGAALSAKVLGETTVVVVTFGDGTSNLGAFHEAINLASCLGLPIVFVCQNNQYAMSMSAKEAMHGASVADRALGYGIPGVQVAGNDVLAVHNAVQVAVRRARAGHGPTLIEALTYRVAGHRSGERAAYQDHEEKQAWLARDPLDRFQGVLTDMGLLDQKELEKINAEILENVAAAMKQAQEDPDPVGDVLGIDEVFAPVTYCGTTT